MEAESNECMQLAEKKKDFNYVIKGNALKRKSKQTEKVLTSLQKEIAELEMKKKKMVWFISDKAWVWIIFSIIRLYFVQYFYYVISLNRLEPLFCSKRNI